MSSTGALRALGGRNEGRDIFLEGTDLLFQSATGLFSTRHGYDTSVLHDHPGLNGQPVAISPSIGWATISRDGHHAQGPCIVTLSMMGEPTLLARIGSILQAR